MAEGSFAVFLRTCERNYPWLPGPLRRRYAHAYGTRIVRVVGAATSVAGLGAQILPQLYERELEYLCREEFALTADDILWRRSKLGLHLMKADLGPLVRWLEARVPTAATAPLEAH
jgi:glycerol-3-phosphate dehydrogenase